MSTQKQRAPQPNTPNSEAAPLRRDEQSQQRANKLDPRGSNQTPPAAPPAKRSDIEDQDGPPSERRASQNARPQSDIPNRQ